MKLLVYPSAFLRREVKPVRRFNSELTDLALQMFEVMRLEKGCGLAANQVGLDKRLIVINMTGEEKDGLVLVNPEIIRRKGKQCEEEGCLSVPGLRLKVRRAACVHVSACDLEGNPFELEAEEVKAVALQHEIDHINGILFIDKIGPATRIGIKQRLLELEKTSAD